MKKINIKYLLSTKVLLLILRPKKPIMKVEKKIKSKERTLFSNPIFILANALAGRPMPMKKKNESIGGHAKTTFPWLIAFRREDRLAKIIFASKFSKWNKNKHDFITFGKCVRFYLLYWRFSLHCSGVACNILFSFRSW